MGIWRKGQVFNQELIANMDQYKTLLSQVMVPFLHDFRTELKHHGFDKEESFVLVTKMFDHLYSQGKSQDAE